jgi:ubiquinone/menaquinone biosynthesis C-methylase UbiE
VSGRRAAERLVRAFDTLAVEPGDRTLEIGCGQGVAVSLVCERLDGGHVATIDHVTAIDRSPKMIEMASKRSAAHLGAWIVSFDVASLHEAGLGGERHLPAVGDAGQARPRRAGRMRQASCNA